MPILDPKNPWFLTPSTSYNKLLIVWLVVGSVTASESQMLYVDYSFRRCLLLSRGFVSDFQEESLDCLVTWVN